MRGERRGLRLRRIEREEIGLLDHLCFHGGHL